MENPLRILSFVAAAAVLFASLAAHADTLYDLNGTLASGTTFTGTIAFSPTGGILNGDTFTAVSLTFSDGSELNSPVFSTPESGEHLVTQLGTFASSSPTFSLITTEVVTGFVNDPVCTLTQYCADELPILNSTLVASIINGQQVETASLQAVPTSATPEPSSIALLGTGMVGVAGVVRKRLV